MAEKRTDKIEVRVEPSLKAAVRARADRTGVPVAVELRDALVKATGWEARDGV